MLRATALALLLLIVPGYAAPPSPFWFDQMAEEDGTPDTGGAPAEDYWNPEPGYYITHPLPGDDVYGDDEWENGPSDPWSCDTSEMERECHPVFDNPDYEPDPNRDDYSEWVLWNDSDDDEPL